MGLLDDTLFGLVGSPGSTDGGAELNELLQRLQAAQNLDPGKAAMTPMAGLSMQNIPMPTVAGGKGDKLPMTAQGTQNTAPSVDSRYLESGTGKQYQQFSPFETSTQNTNPNPYAVFNGFDTAIEPTRSPQSGRHGYPIGSEVEFPVSNMAAKSDRAPAPDMPERHPLRAAFMEQQASPPPSEANPVNVNPQAAPQVSSGKPQYGPRTAQASTGVMSDGDFGPTFAERLANFGDALTGRASGGELAGLTRQRKATFDALIKMGVEPEVARGAVFNPDLLKGVLTQRLAKGKVPDANKQIMWGRDERPGSPTFGQDIPVQSNDAGEINPSKIPDGIRINNGLKKIGETATSNIMQDAAGNTFSMPKDIGDAEFQKQTAQEAAKVRQNMPNINNDAVYLIRAIDEALGDNALGMATGPLGGRTPNWSGRAQRAQSRIDQIQGKTFLAAFNSLRGGGQITEAEGSKATIALNRMQNQKLNDKDYRKAAEEFREGVVDMLNAARRRAGLAPFAAESFQTYQTLKQAYDRAAGPTGFENPSQSQGPTLTPMDRPDRTRPRGMPERAPDNAQTTVIDGQTVKVMPNPNFNPKQPESQSNPRFFYDDGK